MRAAAIALLALGGALAGLSGCARSREPLGPGRLATEVFEMPPANRGAEAYSAWFADRGGSVLYFGLSPFWELLDAGGPSADLREPGDHLIGRFDLARERFLPPLRVRAGGPDVRGSVWDVLVHSSGRVCYTTFFEESGCADPDTGAVHYFPAALGAGLNEISEGPGGHLYVTRYTRPPAGSGAVVVLAADGTRLRELALPASELGQPAAKSVAVDPLSGEIWVNTDTFAPDGGISCEWLRLAPDGTVLERGAAPELLFMRFDARGRGWFAEADGEALRVRVRHNGRELASAALGSRSPLDFVQDIQFAGEETAVLALWSGRVALLRLSGGRISVTWTSLEKPPACRPPRRSLLYSAVLFGSRVYASLQCGPKILARDVPSGAFRQE
jgi:hypothetical protein